MRAEIKYLHSPDIENLERYSPKEEDNFGFLLQIVVGPKGKEGEESFDVMLCTPKWLTDNFRKSDMIFGMHYIIVFEYNYQEIKRKLVEKIENTEGNTWDEIASKLEEIGKWEFEGYKKQ